jgi:hypothetical protein
VLLTLHWLRCLFFIPKESLFLQKCLYADTDVSFLPKVSILLQKCLFSFKCVCKTSEVSFLF